MFLFGLLKVCLAIRSTSGTVIPTNHQICIFFLFHLSFLNQWCCCFVQLISICWASLQHLAVPCYNFPHHLHTYFLIYTNYKILPNKFVLKSCLILVACNSDFFWLSIWWMTTQLVAFDDPCLCWGKDDAHAWEVYFINYITASLFYVYYPSNIFQHTRKMFMYRLLFMVCQCSLKWFCEQKKHFPSIAKLFILIQILNTEFSILDVRFENWGISFEVYSCIFLSFS